MRSFRPILEWDAERIDDLADSPHEHAKMHNRHRSLLQALRVKLGSMPDINLSDGEADLVERGLEHRDGSGLVLTDLGAEWIALYGHVI